MGKCGGAALTKSGLLILHENIATCQAHCSIGTRMSTVYQQNRTADIYGGTIPLTVIATVAVISRLCARKISSAPF